MSCFTNLLCMQCSRHLYMHVVPIFGFGYNYYRVIHQRDPLQLRSSPTNIIPFNMFFTKTQHDYECMDLHVKTRQCEIHNTILYNPLNHIISSPKLIIALSSIFINKINKSYHQKESSS